MEYSKEYKINREMSARSCAEVIGTAQEINKKYRGLEIAINSIHKEDSGIAPIPVDITSIISMMLNSSNTFTKGSLIEVKVSGDYSRNILKNCAEKIGSVFSSNNL